MWNGVVPSDAKSISNLIDTPNASNIIKMLWAKSQYVKPNALRESLIPLLVSDRDYRNP
jgi:hypothetical protein